MFLPPNAAVELVSEEVEEGHHSHVEEEEAHQAGSVEVSQEGIDPNPDRKIHP